MSYVWALAIPLLLLAGCGQNDRICTSPDPTPLVGDWDGCIHRWAYWLADAKVTPVQAGQSIAAACQDAVAASTDIIGPESDYPTASAADVERVRYDRRYDLAVKKATFYVLQARTGNCRKPS